MTLVTVIGTGLESVTGIGTVTGTEIGTVIEIAKETATGTETVIVIVIVIVIGIGTGTGTGTGTEGETEIEIGTEPEIAHPVETVETVAQVDAVSSSIDSRAKSSRSQPRTRGLSLRLLRPSPPPQSRHGHVN